MNTFLSVLLTGLALAGAALIFLSLRLMVNGIPYDEWVRLQKGRGKPAGK